MEIARKCVSSKWYKIKTIERSSFLLGNLRLKLRIFAVFDFLRTEALPKRASENDARLVCSDSRNLLSNRSTVGKNDWVQQSEENMDRIFSEWVQQSEETTYTWVRLIRQKVSSYKNSSIFPRKLFLKGRNALYFFILNLRLISRYSCEKMKKNMHMSGNGCGVTAILKWSPLVRLCGRDFSYGYLCSHVPSTLLWTLGECDCPLWAWTFDA